ncbi:hypothetical protein RDWZM_004301 [Blomia tropicalis]|uniref:RRM domain-containing protein n=1 Tax=Blomia tropicalis TaxID=40697 RepID=A0A9Q0RTD7_BLOTA|nr:Cleavage stimulation factor subunit 2 [Blomia tropicalis]KAJ6225756.1 hypothetical protein RDWZM_004301 [Blomia tropicalis]
MAVAQAATNERSLRSVFVGNIPYDASEEKLKDIFSEVGPVLSFKLVYDRESGKPKGYGFCEYRDQETASSAMRNLNGYELNGRSLRVDTATNERFKEEMKNLQTTISGTTFESPYGQETDPEKTPETIAKVVASLAPEQIFELARQMKHCALTNPNEARNMLVQNPQLAYALLQALVVMRAVDLNAAASILYKPNPAPVNIIPSNIGLAPGQPIPPAGMGIPPPPGMVPNVPPPQQMPMQQVPPVHPFDPMHDMFNRPPINPNAGPQVPPPQQQQQPYFDQRPIIDPRIKSEPMFDPRGNPPPTTTSLDPRIRNQPIDPRQMSQQQTNGMRGPAPAPVPAPMPAANPGQPFGNRFAPPNVIAPPQQPSSQQPTTGSQVSSTPTSAQAEQEKAALIMQVLALSDQQIALLPSEQRQSILQLKEQLARGQS